MEKTKRGVRGQSKLKPKVLQKRDFANNAMQCRLYLEVLNEIRATAM